jgi:hypothetical protein
MKDRDTLYPRICSISGSTNILEVAYDPIDKDMRITFKGGVKYLYKNVHPSIFGDIVKADSAGAKFNEFVKEEIIEGVKIGE